jgi:hypothetical protein
MQLWTLFEDQETLRTSHLPFSLSFTPTNLLPAGPLPSLPSVVLMDTLIHMEGATNVSTAQGALFLHQK